MRFIIFLFFFSSSIAKAQLSYTTISLTKSLDETSGLERFGDYLISHNDSGDDPKLYIFDTDGEKILEVEINKIKNKDWEDLASDSEHVYIADTGNNYATRENLKIYILNRQFIPQGSIQIRYEAQKTFSREAKNEYDAEALAVVGDELILFSKNRKTFKSQIYSFPKVAGDYVLTPRKVIDTQALITAADYSEKDDLMVLTGYNYNGEQFFYTLTNFVKNGFENIEMKKYLISIKPAQIEAIKIINANEFWLSSESEEKKNPRLFHFILSEE